MAFFKCFKKGTVTILEDESDNRDEGTTLLVGAPLLASEVSEVDNSLHIPSWSQEVFCQLSSFKKSKSTDRDLHSTVLQLKSSHHTDTGSSKVFELLSDRIHNGAVNWSSALPTAGESTFTEYYWEWLEDVVSRSTQVLKSTGLYNAVFASLFSYDRDAPVIRAFCEYWCPATNTLHTSQGEMSISLWDLHEIGGLPITSRFYDEVIPTTESLNRKDHKGVSYIPHICRYLFLAYHKILQDSKGKSGVRMTAWIKYWYRGPFKYKKPSRKTIRNKSQKPKEDSDPSGIIPTALKRTEEEEGVFEDLGIADEDMEKSYLAAFLACWLCKFVFPKDDVTLIRPGVFKVASRMAHGVSFGLAVLVLDSIYKGLNDISSADDPGNCTTVLPFHYVYGWLGEYFDTHFTSSSEKSIPIMARFSGRLSAKFFEDSTARALFRTCGDLKDDVRNGTVLSVYSQWKSCLKIGSASTITLPTKDNIREFEVTSDYVIWWSKVHRFESTKSKTISTVGKSSSLSQPKSLKSQGHEVSVHDKLTRGRALQVHLEVEGRETESVADSQEDFIPLGQRIRNLKRGHISSNEDSEVNFRHKKTSVGPLYCDLDTAYPLDDTFFCDVPAVSQPVLMNEGEVVHHVPTVSELVPFNHFPIEEENDALHPIRGSGVSLRGSLVHQHLLKPATYASTSEMSCGEPKLGVADKTLRKVVSVLGNQIKNIILKASLERLPSFKDEIGKLLTTLDNVGADVSSLRAMIDALMVTAVDYHSAHSSYSQKLSPEAQSDRLAAVDSSLSIALALQQAEETHQFSVLESIQSANMRMEELKREQEQLELTLHQLNGSLSESDVQLSYHRREVTRLREDKIAVEEAPILSDADAETLDTLRVSFERLRNSFKDLSWGQFSC
ncbi:unnamed protein product [Prunus brigantina]